MIKGIIFDMDGVLINSEELYRKYEYKFFKNLAPDFDINFLDKFMGTATRYLVKEVVDKYQITMIPEDKLLKMLDEGGSLIYTQNPKLKLCNGVLDWLEYFHNNNYKLTIASSTITDNIDVVVEKFGLEKYFKSYIGGNMVEKTKPEPEIFLKAAQLLDLKPEECLVIEDSANGLKAAKAAGCKTIGYLNEGLNTQDLKLADLVFDKFGQEKIPMLEKFIKKLNIN